ncbi:MAG: hypothetical protein K0Q72_828 [Armatimonadetes bacterium]|jgi:hypothetical protein|nr:hypothetical protein [Armatimonadota bacterium]
MTIGRRAGGGALEIRAGEPRVARALVWHGLIRFPADRIHKAVVETLARGVVFYPEAPEGDLAAGRELVPGRGRDQLTGAIGFRVRPTALEQERLRQSWPLLLKLQYVLWARAFAEMDAEPGKPVRVTWAQLCEDLGYARLRNGAHRPEHKRLVAALADLLTSLSLRAEYRAPDGRSASLAGPVWQRHPELESERIFAYSPGAWQDDPVWKAFNHAVGLARPELLRLRPDRDRWAIAVGGYLAVLARMNGYRALTLRVATLLERTGLEEAERRNPARMREMLERALDRLEEARIIGGWDWASAATGEPDMDAPGELAALADAAAGWAGRSVVICWPAALVEREPVLAAARKRRRTASRRTNERTPSRCE